MKLKITLQEVFNKVWERAKVKVKSSDPADITCTYRNSDGSQNHCFVGICIPDELYRPEMDDSSGGVEVNEHVRKLFPEKLIPALAELQRIHDCSEPSDWGDQLIKFAKKHDLKIPE